MIYFILKFISQLLKEDFMLCSYKVLDVVWWIDIVVLIIKARIKVY